jgi:hypothetical protein
MLATCRFTVNSLTMSRFAICGLLSPSAIRGSTSSSRAESSPPRVLGGGPVLPECVDDQRAGASRILDGAELLERAAGPFELGARRIGPAQGE